LRQHFGEGLRSANWRHPGIEATILESRHRRAAPCDHQSQRASPVAALLATVAGLFLTAQLQIAEREEATSRFYLQQYQAGFDTAYEILESATEGDAMLRRK
jgi:hypothetical protein